MLATLFSRRRGAVGYSVTQCKIMSLSFQTWMIESAASYDLQGRANQGWQCLGIQLSYFKFRVRISGSA
jgi:hypothetical protein